MATCNMIKRMRGTAYMGDIMAQVGWEVWGMNMAGIVQCSQSGAPDTKATI